MKPIPYVDLAAQFAAERGVLERRIGAVLSEGQWIAGAQVDALERRIASRLGCAHTVGVGSGTDALVLAMKGLGIGPGDEVITPPNSFVASTAAIVHTGAKPVFADVLDDQTIDPVQIERAITPRTKAIMPVHLTGRTCRMPEILAVAGAHGLFVVEDAAQAFGSKQGNKATGTFGDVGCFSAHPLKNLNAMGDAGFVATNDDAIAARIRRLRSNGLVDRNTVAEWGTVSRLDTIQAVVLDHRLDGLDDVIAARRSNAACYRALLDPALVFHPASATDDYDTFHTFVVQVDRRDELQRWLADRGIGTSIHYPVPIHLQPAAASLGHAPGDFPVTERQAAGILSLPIHQFLTDGDIARVVASIHEFLR
jgi:dTDP-4-amino-4,6-dideoxygalactose transaminase